ncbi:MAG: GNA1162 family protein [Nitrospinales bacterium]
MTLSPTSNSRRKNRPWGLPKTVLILTLSLALGFGGCSAKLRTRVSGNLNELSRNMTVAILPVATTESGQRDAAQLFRQSLFAKLKQSRFQVIERYLVDGYLKKHGLTKPEQIKKISPIRLGEILGADAVLTSSMTKMKRSYFVLHSSIELGVFVTLTDTRSGEILWMADQTEADFEGIGKIPTGIASAVLAPVHFVTNKINLRKMTSKMTNKLIALVKKPELAENEEKFNSPMVSAAVAKEIRDMGAAPPPVQAQNVQTAALTNPAPDPEKGATSANPSPDDKRPADGFFTIQVGAYKKKASAKTMMGRLAAKGYNVFLTLFGTEPDTLYKVQVERFGDKEQAYHYAEEFYAREKLDNFVTAAQAG